jgi:hypothetical protein
MNLLRNKKKCEVRGRKGGKSWRETLRRRNGGGGGWRSPAPYRSAGIQNKYDLVMGRGERGRDEKETTEWKRMREEERKKKKQFFSSLIPSEESEREKRRNRGENSVVQMPPFETSASQFQPRKAIICKMITDP